MLLICIKENRISNLGTYMVLCNIIHYVVQTDFTSPEFYILITTITETTSISSDSHLWLHGLVEPLPLLGCNLVNHTVHLQPHDCNYCVCIHNSLLHYLDTQWLDLFIQGVQYAISAASQRAPPSPPVALQWTLFWVAFTEATQTHPLWSSCWQSSPPSPLGSPAAGRGPSAWCCCRAWRRPAGCARSLRAPGSSSRQTSPSSGEPAAELEMKLREYWSCTITEKAQPVVVAAFNQVKAIARVFSMIVQLKT